MDESMRDQITKAMFEAWPVRAALGNWDDASPQITGSYYGMCDAAMEIISPIIVDVLCGQALADHLGDVRDEETKLWNLLGAPKIPDDHPVWDSDSAWKYARARLKIAGLPLPSYLSDDDDD